MAKSAGKGEGVDPLQIRLNPRIHKLISERTKAHGTTMKAEIEELIVKGEQLEKMMGQRGRIGMEVLLRACCACRLHSFLRLPFWMAARRPEHVHSVCSSVGNATVLFDRPGMGNYWFNRDSHAAMLKPDRFLS